MRSQPGGAQPLAEEHVLWPEQPGISAEKVRFGRFCLIPGARKLLADGRPVSLGSRAFDLLVVLVNARGTVVSKDEIMNCVWPSSTVEESNLRFQMAALRRALGEDRDVIKTISGRGYLLAAEAPEAVEVLAETDIADKQAPGPGSVANVPDLASPLRHCPLDLRSPARSETQSTIAVIDDDPFVRESLHGLVRSAGLRAELFASAQEFLDHIPESPPECLVLDVWLPGQNGLDFYAELAKADVKLPVIFISGHADVPMSVRAMKGGAVDFLIKPVHHMDLLNAIRRAIQIASQARS